MRDIGKVGGSRGPQINSFNANELLSKILSTKVSTGKEVKAKVFQKHLAIPETALAKRQGQVFKEIP